MQPLHTKKYTIFFSSSFKKKKKYGLPTYVTVVTVVTVVSVVTVVTVMSSEKITQPLHTKILRNLHSFFPF